MKNFNDYKIGIRLNICLCGALIIIITSIGFYIINNSKNRIIADADQSMNEQVKDLVYMIDIQIKNKQKIVNISLNLAHDYLYGLGNIVENNKSTIKYRAINQITKEEQFVNVNKWTTNNRQIQNNFEIVDKLHAKSIETATIFQKIPQGYLRITTNVRNNDSTRAVGTFIPNNSPVVQVIERGETYKGRAFVVNDWYLTAYEPISINGEIKGILYVGVKEKNMEEIKKIFSEKTYFKNGFPSIVDEEGTLIVHPLKVGTNISQTDYFKMMLTDKTKGIHKISFFSENQEQHLYYTYFEPTKSFISATIFAKDIDIVQQRNAILFGLSIGLCIFIVIVILITRNITSSINKGVIFANHLSKGNLDQTINLNQNDEIGVLTNSLNNMVIKLREVIISINENVLNVNYGSEQISISSQQIALGANEQAATAEEIGSTIEEMVAAINQNTENAQQAEKIAINAETGINEAKKATSNTLETMRNIADKINIIREIASKTDLLAINAAIEASKAGEYGKGFAVVASEIRKLAENTQKAAQVITELTKTSVIVAEKAEMVLTEIVPDVHNTARLVQEIAAASSEQNINANQINKAVQQFNVVVQQNSSSAEELSTGAEELSAQSHNLKDVVGFFNLNGAKNDISQFQLDVMHYLEEAFKNAKNKNFDNFDISIKPKEKLDNYNVKKTNGVNIKLGDKEQDNEFEKY